MHCLNILCHLNSFFLLIGSVFVRVEFDNDVYIYINNHDDDVYYDYYAYGLSDELCFLNTLVLRNKNTNETFQAEYPGSCTRPYYRNYVVVKMNSRDYFRLLSNKFINITSTTVSLEMYNADNMFVYPFNLRIEPDDAIQCDVILHLTNLKIHEIDYWINEGILLILVNTLLDVATVNVSKLLLHRDANNTAVNVNIMSGEILNQSPGLTSSVAIRLTLTDQDLLVSKGICTYDQACFISIKSGFAATHYGQEVRSFDGYPVYNRGTAPTGKRNVL